VPSRLPLQICFPPVSVSMRFCRGISFPRLLSFNDLAFFFPFFPFLFIEHSGSVSWRYLHSTSRAPMTNRKTSCRFYYVPLFDGPAFQDGSTKPPSAFSVAYAEHDDDCPSLRLPLCGWYVFPSRLGRSPARFCPPPPCPHQCPILLSPSRFPLGYAR